ncbi:MAG: T9SS type A sorting domain-containing protein [Bacteroidota bacterium]
MRYFFLLLLVIALCTCGRAQTPSVAITRSVNVTVSASIGLADDQCQSTINDPDIDCAEVPVGENSLLYSPGEDGDIIVSYRLANNSSATLTRITIVDSDRGTIIPITNVSISPGRTLVTNRIYPAETQPRTVTATVTADLESAGGARLTVEGEYVLEVVAPSVSTEFGMMRKKDICPNAQYPGECFNTGTEVEYGVFTLNIGATDTIFTRLNWTNTGLSTIDWTRLTDQDGTILATSFGDVSTGAGRIIPLFIEVPSVPGTYARSMTFTVTDLGGNTTSETINYTIIVEGPAVSTQFSLMRKEDACPLERLPARCSGTDFGNFTLQVGARDTIYIRLDFVNTGLSTIHLATLTNQDGLGFGNFVDPQVPGVRRSYRLFRITPADPGTYARSLTLTVTDSGGNTISETINYTLIVDCSILDNAPPEARCQDITVEIPPDETVALTPQQVDGGSSDNCGTIADSRLDINAFTCEDEGPNVVTLTVKDESDNPSSCTANVTVSLLEVYPGRADDCVASTSALNPGQTWQNILEPGGKLVAQVNIGANGNIRNAAGSVFKTGNDLDDFNGMPFLSKRIDLTMLDGGLNAVQPDTEPVRVRLYYTEAELLALRGATGTTPSDFVVIKSDLTDCRPGYDGLDAVNMNATFITLDCGQGGYYEFSTSGFSTFYLFPSEAVLPVELSSFTAHALPKQQAQLNWTTQTETGNSHFVVERSADGRTFVQLGAVAGAGESTTEQAYVFRDEAALAGDNYYRLRQVDFDGTEELSEVRVVTFAGGNELTVYPNPAINELRINGFAGGPVSVLDAGGREVLSTRLAEGEALPVSHLAPGMYLLRAGEMVVRWVKK